MHDAVTCMPPAVSGDANFFMEQTALTVGGFTQPGVARNLIELSTSIEKGLTQRFLWLFPKPSFAKFDKLEVIEERFSAYIGELGSVLHVAACILVHVQCTCT